jgi:hypothetical protein
MVSKGSGSPGRRSLRRRAWLVILLSAFFIVIGAGLVALWPRFSWPQRVAGLLALLAAFGSLQLELWLLNQERIAGQVSAR